MSIESTCILVVATALFLVFGLLSHAMPKYIAKTAVSSHVFLTVAHQREMIPVWKSLADAIRAEDDDNLLPLDLQIVRLELQIPATDAIGEGADVSLLHGLREAVLVKLREVNQTTMPYCKASDIAQWIDLAYSG